MMRIAVGSDHRGTSLADRIARHLEGLGHSVRRCGPADQTAVDYPDAAFAVATDVAGGQSDRGVLICGTGIGVCITANKIHGVRAGLVHDELTARLSRSHNDANVLCLSGDLLGERQVEKIVDTFLTTDFEGGRHARRVDKIAAIERGEGVVGA